MTALEKQLRLEIKRQLSKCDGTATPHVCHAIQTKAGYLRMETQIIEKIIQDGITPAAAIGQIESDWA